MKVVLHGSFNNENFGDLLLARVYSDKIKEMGGSELYGSNVNKLALDYANLLPGKPEGKDYKTIFCGGGYFGEPDNITAYWLYRFLTKHVLTGVQCRLKGVDYGLFGVGFGPFKNPITRFGTRLALNGASKVLLRDKESVSYLNHYNDKLSATLCADAILSCGEECLDSLINDEVSSFSTDSEIKLLVHLPGKSYNKQQREMIVRSIRSTLQKFKNTSIVVASDCSIGKEYDFFSWLEGANVTVVRYTTPSKLLSIIKDSSHVITTKLHVGICASVYSKRVVSFYSHSKTKRLYAQLGRNDCAFELNTITSDVIEDRFNVFFSKNELSIKIPNEVIALSNQIWIELSNFIKA